MMNERVKNVNGLTSKHKNRSSSNVENNLTGIKGAATTGVLNFRPGEARMVGSMPMAGGSLIPSTQGLVGGVAAAGAQNNPFIQTDIPTNPEQ